MGVLIIAEAGVNHNGDISLAHKLIDAAKEAGADIVKFQTYDCEKLDPPGERREMLRKLQLSRVDHIVLARHADKIGIEFLSTPFDVESLNFLVELGVKRIKIASGQMANEPLRTAAIEARLPVLLSCGMIDEDQIEEVIDEWACDLTLLHCTSSYPCPDKDVSLNVMNELSFIHNYGFSDHSEGIVAAIGAVALGATVIEKHLTLDRNMDGPDHKASIEPAQFKEMVIAIRRMEIMLGDGVKRIMPSEAYAVQVAKERAEWRAMSS